MSIESIQGKITMAHARGYKHKPRTGPNIILIIVVVTCELYILAIFCIMKYLLCFVCVGICKDLQIQVSGSTHKNSQRCQWDNQAFKVKD